jgi:cell division protein ZapA
MPTVTIPLNGRNYDIACGPGEEDRVQEVATRLRERMEGVSRSLGGGAGVAPQENVLFAVTSLLLADELEQREKELGQARLQLRDSAQHREVNLAQTLERLAGRIEAIAARLEAA